MPITPSDLRCEYAVRPLGIATSSPRLSWKLNGSERGQRQTGYQIQVAQDDAFAGILWDSGKVLSDRSLLVPYEGDSLRTGRRYYWRVRAWDQEGVEGQWSPAEFWEMGLLHESDWKAYWIGRQSERSPLLRKAFTLRESPTQATLFVCGLGYHECYLNGRKVGDHVLDPAFTRYDRRALYVAHDVTDQLLAGENVLGAMLGNGWYNCQTKEVWSFEHAPWRDTPKLLLQLHATYPDGSQETIVSDTTWRISDGPIVFDALRNGEFYDAREEREGWTVSGYDDSGWAHAENVASPGGAITPQTMPPCRVMRTLEPVSVGEVRDGVWVYDLGQNIAGWAQLTVDAPRGTEIVLRYAEKLKDDGDIDQSNI
ncbi:MAG TPA: family 78 glycoside hydrolase catalytic domain, partial [Fimbriimonas sp.]